MQNDGTVGETLGMLKPSDVVIAVNRVVADDAACAVMVRMMDCMGMHGPIREQVVENCVYVGKQLRMARTGISPEVATLIAMTLQFTVGFGRH